ncbi:MAG: universal stress protein [Aquirhabdus sp.]
MYHKILVALDGSPTSDLALQEAVKVAEVGTKVFAISVVENPLSGYTPVAAYDYAVMHDAFLQQSKNILEKARRDIQHHSHVQLETHIIDLSLDSIHDLAKAIEDAAKKYQAELIVIGTHGRKGVKRFFLGSVAEQVIRTSELPVLVVRNQSLSQKK